MNLVFWAVVVAIIGLLWWIARLLNALRCSFDRAVHAHAYEVGTLYPLFCRLQISEALEAAGASSKEHEAAREELFFLREQLKDEGKKPITLGELQKAGRLFLEARFESERRWQHFHFMVEANIKVLNGTSISEFPKITPINADALLAQNKELERLKSGLAKEYAELTRSVAA